MVNRIEKMFSCGVGAEIYKRCIDTVASFNMMEKIRSGVLVGLSGGADSVMLLSFLSHLRMQDVYFPILAVHVNHSIRGEEADRDERFSREVADMLGVDFLSERIDVPSLAEKCGLGIEEAARNARYDFFGKLISCRPELGCIAVAHNSTDNLETVIFNLMRGAGSLGLSGISPMRDNIIRPLIASSKAEITAALNENSIPYVTDSTNLVADYTRNYIRLEVIPKLSRLSASPEESARRAGENLRADDEYITSVANEFLKGRDALLCSDLKALHFSVFSRAVSLFARRAGCLSLERVHFDAIRSLLQKENFSVSLPGDFEWVSEYGLCRICKRTQQRALYGEISEGENVFDDIGMSVVYSSDPGEKTFSNVYNFSIQAKLSSAIINGSVYFRSRADGDAYKYGGATRRLKKLFNDCKIPPSVRDKIPVFCDDSGILWVPGFGVRDDGVRGSCGYLTVNLSNRSDLFIPKTSRK